MVKSAFSGDRKANDLGMSFRFRKLRVETRPRARAFADSSRAGFSPATITADVGALQLIVPRGTALRQKQDGGRKAR